MDAIPPSIWLVPPAEIRCVGEEPCWKADHEHDVAHQHDDIDPLPFPGAPEPPFMDLPGRQVLDLPQRAWWEQAEQGHRAVQMVNRRASVIATTL